MRYFIVSYKGTLSNNRDFDGDTSFTCNVYPPKKDIYKTIQSLLDNYSVGNFKTITIINIIELSEEDYNSYIS